MPEVSRGSDPVRRRLRDGTEIDVRPIRADDKERLAAGFERLSPESRYRRFFSPAASLTPSQLRYLTEVDHHGHEALLALEAGTDNGVGVARFVRTGGDPPVAEVAVAVVDDGQGRGVATTLLDDLAARARRGDDPARRSRRPGARGGDRTLFCLGPGRKRGDAGGVPRPR
jgi:GNAT superfamily N-acetyltransferase